MYIERQVVVFILFSRYNVNNRISSVGNQTGS